MGKRHIFTLPDGRVAIISLFEGLTPDKAMFELSRPYLDSGDPTMTPEELEHWRLNVHFLPFTGSPVSVCFTCDALDLSLERRNRIHGVHYTGPPLFSCWECDEHDIPHDRSFRGAWEEDGAVVKVNMPKARGIHMDHIRVVRNAELVKEDITFMRAVEAGDASAQSTVATKKQVLRDIPATFDITTGVTTPELLKAKWPTELPTRE